MIGLMRSNNRPSLGRVSIALGVALALLMAAIWASLDTGRLPIIELETPRGRIVVELADTAATRSTGLSDRDALSGIDGMLLKWDAPGRHPIWMAGMRFPLDLLWIDGDGRVLSVLPNVPPCRAEPCTIYEPRGTNHSVAVLELPAGEAAWRSLTAGTTVQIHDLSHDQ